MREIRSLTVGAIGLLAASICQSASAASVKRFEWGIETWQIGTQDFLIRINEKSPVRILSIEGNLTAGPQPLFKPFDNVVRQTLITLINVGDDTAENVAPVEVLQTAPNRVNNAVSPHLFSLNVKQTNDHVLNIPISYRYKDFPVTLLQNKLLFRAVNESYRCDPQTTVCKVSTEQFDTINAEVHVTITYVVGDQLPVQLSIPYADK